MRGEKVGTAFKAVGKVGSSPHARGKAICFLLCDYMLRIIPACAGKRRTSTFTARSTRDHPRMRGEKRSKTFRRCVNAGSSPHARGKADFGKYKSTPYRIIPACAGKSSNHRKSIVKIQDHPRMRGEKPHLTMVVIPTAGSSPHARGKVVFNPAYNL